MKVVKRGLKQYLEKYPSTLLKRIRRFIYIEKFRDTNHRKGGDCND